MGIVITSVEEWGKVIRLLDQHDHVWEIDYPENLECRLIEEFDHQNEAHIIALDYDWNLFRQDYDVIEDINELIKDNAGLFETIASKETF